MKSINSPFRTTACLAGLLVAFPILVTGNELVPLNEFATAEDWTENFTITAITNEGVVHSDEDDGGLGQGGFIHIPDGGGNTNFVYDTDDTPGSQAFGDVTVSADQSHVRHSVGFIVRGHEERDDSIRLLFTQRNRVRIWKEANVNEHDPGTLLYDETLESAEDGWVHLRLDVRNTGENGDQVELVFRAYNSQTRFDETTLATEHSHTLSAEDSEAYLEPGEVGFRMLGVGTRVDNFAVYEYGTAPSSRPHPEVVNRYPAPDALFHPAQDGLNFDLTSTLPIEEEDISVWLNDEDISGQLSISGEPDHRTVHYDGLTMDTDYDVWVEASAGETTTTLGYAFRTASPPQPAPLIDLIEFAAEEDVDGNFTLFSAGNEPSDDQDLLVWNPEWDGGIGRGGYLETAAGQTNFLYTPNDSPATYQDFTISLDARAGASVAFIVRADTSIDDSIRVMVTNRNRIRIWTGSSITAGDTGTLQVDETVDAGLTPGDWYHMRLDVRNLGPEWQEEIELTLSLFDEQHRLDAPGAVFTHVIPTTDAFLYREAGEVGIRAVSNGTEIDNFRIYEYEQPTTFRPHPIIQDISPGPGTTIAARDGISFEVTGNEPIEQEEIRMVLDGGDVTESLGFEGDSSHWFVDYSGLSAGEEYFLEIEATSESGAISTAYFNFQTLADRLDLNISGLTRDNGIVSFFFDTEDGAGYAVQFSPDLLDWTTLENVSGDGDTYEVSHEPNENRAFYRIVLAE